MDLNEFRETTLSSMMTSVLREGVMGILHSKKEVCYALAIAVKRGWRWVEKSNNHTVGYLACTLTTVGCHQREMCLIPVFGTPKNPANHAKKIQGGMKNLFCQ